MASKFFIGVIITVILFFIGIIVMSFSKSFTQEWLIGVGIIAAAIGVITLSIFLKMRK